MKRGSGLRNRFFVCIGQGEGIKFRKSGGGDVTILFFAYYKGREG